ncbi:MAG: hypothetical protein AB1689_09000, partial [Thermodesulfobacteriota bacterium]
ARPKVPGSPPTLAVRAAPVVPVVLAVLAVLVLPAPGGATASDAAAAAVDAAACPPTSAVAILTSPRVPRAGEPLRIIAATASDVDGALVVGDVRGGLAAMSEERRGAAPWWWTATVPSASAGSYRVAVGRGADVAGCAVVVVASSAARARPRPPGAVWGVEREWDRGTESLYAAWVEQLFADPLDAEPSWKGIGELLTDPGRNLLYDHLGLDEDSGGGMDLEPDCADLPYFLRAYFAWKLGLPFGYSGCSRGTATSPPRCDGWHSNLDPETAASAQDEVARFLHFARRDVGWGVHSGSGRTPAAADRTDLYPTRITPGAIRPGTVFADPYGHTLVVVARIPQSADAGGLLLAVDAQPDGTVARKRFWRGNFLFALDPRLGGAGFKNFRPIVEQGSRLRRLDNDEIERHPEFGDFSLEQYVAGVDGFYERVDAMLSPEPQDPTRAFRETIAALDEQIGARIRSVANGEEYVARNRGTIAMPEGAAIFETTGAWEDYATPSRDLRLLIAIDVVRGFPARVGERPGRYALPPGSDPAGVRRALERLLEEEAAAHRFTYVRSDGSEWTITLADVLERATALETAYNPNDCVEVRWGAPQGSEEARTCRRRAPAAQKARMERYREWFRERRRPPRG